MTLHVSNLYTRTLSSMNNVAISTSNITKVWNDKEVSTFKRVQKITPELALLAFRVSKAFCNVVFETVCLPIRYPYFLYKSNNQFSGEASPSKMQKTIHQKPIEVKAANYSSASVLPYYYNTEEKCVYFLLGKEAYGHAAGKWCDFGGDKDKRDLRPSITACRELVEETIGLAKPLSDNIIKGLKNTTKFYTNGHSIHHEYITSMNGADMSPNNLRSEFKKLRSGHHLAGSGHHLAGVQKEKRDIGWIKADDLGQAVLNRKQEGKRLVNRIAKVYSSPISTAEVICENGELRSCLGGTISKIIKKVGVDFSESCHGLQKQAIGI